MTPDEVMFLWFAIGIPLTALITFLLIRKKIAPWLGIENLRRDKDSRVGGIAGMLAGLSYSVKPSSYQIMKARFLVLAVILLAPEGAGLFMYLLLWAIIPKDKAEKELSVS